MWLVSVAYFVGQLWFVIIEAYFDIDYLRENEVDYDTFLMKYNLDDLHQQQSIKLPIMMTYFLTTTMATVGLGDLRPHNDFERITCVILMLFGVSFFSYLNTRVVTTIQIINDIMYPH